ncbi:unnamed protein product, partial [Allacma fusca]
MIIYGVPSGKPGRTDLKKEALLSVSPSSNGSKRRIIE